MGVFFDHEKYIFVCAASLYARDEERISLAKPPPYNQQHGCLSFPSAAALSKALLCACREHT